MARRFFCTFRAGLRATAASAARPTGQLAAGQHKAWLLTAALRAPAGGSSSCARSSRPIPLHEQQRCCSASAPTEETAPDEDESQVPESPLEMAAAEEAETDEIEEFLSLPAAWRDAGQWVDLEFERAGLLEGTDSISLESDWGSEKFPHPESGVLFPHAAINDHRRRPFFVPGNKQPSSAKGGMSEEKATKQVEANRERLGALWRSSSSHGISWDDLDEAYVRFAKTGTKRYDEWARSPKDEACTAQKMKEQAMERARKHLQRFCPEGKDALELHPSHCKRLASRFFNEEKRKWLSPWRPGRLTVHLQQLVVARMLRRETEERAFGLRQTAGGEANVSAPTEPARKEAAPVAKRPRQKRK